MTAPTSASRSRFRALTASVMVIAAFAAASGVCAAPAVAETETQRSSLRGVTAELFSESDGSSLAPQNIDVTITRRGQTYGPFAPGPACEGFCLPARSGSRGRAVRVVNLDADSEPEIVVDYFRLGAHCCFVSYVYDYQPSRDAYRVTGRNWLDAETRIRVRGGSGQFVSADARFAYVFASFADSVFPIQIWRYLGGRFIDITRRHRADLIRDVGQMLRYYRSSLAQRREVGCILAAYAADSYRLGRGARARTFIRRAIRRGALGQGAASRSYLPRLLRFLKARGYA